MSEIHDSIRETEIASITGIDRLKLKAMRGVQGADWFRAEGSGRPVWWSKEAFQRLVQSVTPPGPFPPRVAAVLSTPPIPKKDKRIEWKPETSENAVAVPFEPTIPDPEMPQVPILLEEQTEPQKSVMVTGVPRQQTTIPANRPVSVTIRA